MKRLLILFLLMVFGIGVNSFATTYYVKPSGSDSNNGTSEPTAWQHIAKACTMLVAGDTVLIRAGVYNELSPDLYGMCAAEAGEPDCGPLTPKNSGTSGNEIVYKGYPGERPTIKGNLGGNYGDYAASLWQKSYVVFDSLEITNSYRGITIKDCNYITIKNCNVHDTEGPNWDNNGGVIVIYAEQSYNITVQACSLYDIRSETGQDPNCSGLHIYHCTNCLFENNVCYDQPSGNGIYLKTNDTSCVVRNNKVYDSGYGIRLGGGRGKSLQAYENLVFDCTEGITVWGEDGPNSNIKVYNNVVYQVDGGGIVMENQGNNNSACSLWNNIVMNCDEYEGKRQLTVLVSNHPNFWSDYNCWYDNSSSQVIYWHGSNWTLAQFQANTAYEDHGIQQNPLFVNPSIDPVTADFHLQSSSPCKGIGRNGEDMGAYPKGNGEEIQKRILIRK